MCLEGVLQRKAKTISCGLQIQMAKGTRQVLEMNVNRGGGGGGGGGSGRVQGQLSDS